MTRSRPAGAVGRTGVPFALMGVWGRGSRGARVVWSIPGARTYPDSVTPLCLSSRVLGGGEPTAGLPGEGSAVACARSQQRLLLMDAPPHNTFLELWTMVHVLIPGVSRPYLHPPLKAPSEENQDYYHKVVIRLHRVGAAGRGGVGGGAGAARETMGGRRRNVLSCLVQVTQPFILRRTKRDVEKQLTRKYEHVLKCRLSSRQKALYEDVILQPG